MSINAGGGPYHCSIHPSMVGTIVQGASLAR
jgi:plastocyanin